jgi:hypothetical protein
MTQSKDLWVLTVRAFCVLPDDGSSEMLKMEDSAFKRWRFVKLRLQGFSSGRQWWDRDLPWRMRRFDTESFVFL